MAHFLITEQHLHWLPLYEPFLNKFWTRWKLNFFTDFVQYIHTTLFAAELSRGVWKYAIPNTEADGYGPLAFGALYWWILHVGNSNWSKIIHQDTQCNILSIYHSSGRDIKNIKSNKNETKQVILEKQHLQKSLLYNSIFAWLIDLGVKF